MIAQFIQAECTADRLTVAVERLFDDPRARAEQGGASEAVRKLLLANGEDPSDRAARTVLRVAGQLP